MNVVIYARVSTKDQNIEQQIEFCKRYCKSNGWNIVWTLSDKESGTIPLKERKTFKKLLNTVRGDEEGYNFTFDTVLIYKLDRLTRNWDDVAYIEESFRESKYNLLSTSDPINFHTSEGRFMFRLLLAMAVKEVETMKERQKIGILRAKAEGKFIGGKRGSKMEIDINYTALKYNMSIIDKIQNDLDRSLGYWEDTFLEELKEI